jgi:hypothetical protein
MNWKISVGILLLPLIALAVWFGLTQYALNPKAVPFSHEGNLIKDNPGFEPGIWYLSYEEPGSPGHSVVLVFDQNSRCGSEENQTVCNISFQQGERVRIEGEQRDGVVLVKKLVYRNISNETGLRIKLYFYNPSLDQGEGGVQCTEKGLVAVERVIPETQTPLTEAIKLLLRGEISPDEENLGIESEFPLDGLSLKSATIQNGVATLTFADPQNKTVGGACRVSVLWNQIEATAKQFPTITSVRFLPEELFQP